MSKTIGQIAPQNVPRGLPNCGVVAVAHFTGEDYERVWNFLSRTRKGNWKGRTHREDLKAFAYRVGVRLKSRTYRKGRREDGTKFTPPTLKQWVLMNSPQGCNRRYLVWTTGHVQVVQGGKVLDQCVENPVPVLEHPLRRKLVTEISWEVTNDE